MRRGLQFTCLAFLALAFGLSLPAYAWMAIGQEIYDHDLALSVADPCYYTEFGDSVAELNNDIWAISGLRGTVGIASVQWEAGGLRIGDSNWQFGSVLYHFTTTDLVAGGAITIDATYAGTLPYIEIATSVVEPEATDTYGRWKLHSWTASYTTQLEVATYGERKEYTVNIPESCKEFWVRISKPSNAYSYSALIHSMDVQANVIVGPDGCVTPNEADLNGDCGVDLMDFAKLAEQWMECDDPDNPADCMPALPWAGANDYN